MPPGGTLLHTPRLCQTPSGMLLTVCAAPPALLAASGVCKHPDSGCCQAVSGAKPHPEGLERAQADTSA